MKPETSSRRRSGPDLQAYLQEIDKAPLLRGGKYCMLGAGFPEAYLRIFTARRRSRSRPD